MVGEFVRHFIESEQRDTCYADVETIARGQLAWEDSARAQQPELLILDTHLLSNLLWSRLLFDAAPQWLESELLARRYDLHLLLDPSGMPWLDDGQRCQPQLQERQAFHGQCRDWLELHQQQYCALGGDWKQRRDATLEAVRTLLAS
jgi:nicotinamide riboside kinase